MLYNKFLLFVYGDHKKKLPYSIEKFLLGIPHEASISYDLYNNYVYDTGLPKDIIRYDGVELVLHGIAFPHGMDMDSFSEGPTSYLESVISKYRAQLGSIPKGFINGSFVGVAVDTRESSVYAFSCFLNSIPFYYTVLNKSLILCTDLSLIAEITSAQLDRISQGLIEYYVQGTNLSEHTAFEQIKTIPKGAYLKFKDAQIEIAYYYTMPGEETGKSFNHYVDEFADLWPRNIRSLHSQKYRYGIGITGGVDSRLILSELSDKSAPLLYTGSHPDHPDYLLAHSIIKSLGLDNHVLEDYRFCNKLHGYAEYCAISDNPLLCNSLNFIDQMEFRSRYGLVYELIGLTEFLGGVYHYWDRRSVKNAFKMALPIKRHRMTSDFFSNRELINLGLRNATKDDDLIYFSKTLADDLTNLTESSFSNLSKQIGVTEYIENWLERFRHIHKMSNLLVWTVLPGRKFNEHLSPSMNIEMTDFACKIPLEFRDSRRILLAYLKRYHPETAKFVLSGYMFSARSPWFLYKLLSPHIKVLNHLGIKVPFLQWYIRKHEYKVINKMPEIYIFQRAVCQDSEFIKSTPFATLLSTYPNDHSRLIRIFNMAVLEKRLLLGEDGLRDYLLRKVKGISQGTE